MEDYGNLALRFLAPGKGKTVPPERDQYLVRQDGLETAAEIAEVVPILMHLDSLAIILDLREHAVGTLLHCILDGLAGLSLRVGKAKPGDFQ